MTRAAPARLLGLADRGHLGPGALADVAVYRRHAGPHRDVPRRAHLVFKNGDAGRARRRRDAISARAARSQSRPPLRGRAIAIAGIAGSLRRALRGWPRDVMAGRRRLPRRRPGRSRMCHAGADPQRRPQSTTPSRRPSACAPPAIVITADTPAWARQAAVTMTGFATSVIGCGCEAGIDRELDPLARRPTARPGVRVLLFAFDRACSRSSSQTPRRPVRAHLPGLGLLRRPRRRGAAQARRRACAISATAGRSRRRSAAGATGASR